MTTSARCHACGRLEHIDLIDGKAPAGADPETADYDRLECIACYGPGWLPATHDAFGLSINEELHGLYLGFRIRRWLRDRWSHLQGKAAQWLRVARHSR